MPAKNNEIIAAPGSAKPTGNPIPREVIIIRTKINIIKTSIYFFDLQILFAFEST